MLSKQFNFGLPFGFRGEYHEMVDGQRRTDDGAWSSYKKVQVGKGANSTKNFKHQDIKQKEPLQKYRLGTISNTKLLAGLNRLFEPKGSRELKIGIPMHTKVLLYKSVVHGVFKDMLS